MMMFDKKFKNLEERIVGLNEEISNLKEKIFWLEHPSKFKLKDMVYFLDKDKTEIGGIIIEVIKEKTSKYSGGTFKTAYDYYPIPFLKEKISYYKYKLIDKNYITYLVEEEDLLFVEERTNNDNK
jgi:hypothetical protein